ncbi:hypothetical protein RRG08_060751 [Elysia crispata]|uniref:Uncharacterized protein n=1 Tax=Elysia crispata TaxID=231223 RepID=A0AAE1CXC9_9GAST|nr:hypothetical protein RRG08_060751 [Elysia crispata]
MKKDGFGRDISTHSMLRHASPCLASPIRSRPDLDPPRLLRVPPSGSRTEGRGVTCGLGAGSAMELECRESPLWYALGVQSVTGLVPLPGRPSPVLVRPELFKP